MDDLAPLFGQSVSLATPREYDRHGQVKAWSEPRTYPARVTFGAEQVKVEGGDVETVTGKAWIGATPIVNPNDRITLPDGKVQRVVKVETISDEFGPHHVKVYF